ncbi:tetratricopeptide repeat protein [Shewanella seohaensis]|uniref:tetratricopeptide repeat protein n=1 Tax=Shewanella seohaensis TaxID=755175 RepID=UPI0035B71AF1
MLKIEAVILLLLPIFILFGCASADQNIDSGLWHYNAGLYDEAIPKLLSGTESLYKSNSSDARLPAAYLALANMAANDKRFDIAEKYYKKAISVAEKYNSGDARIMRNVTSSAGNYYLDNKQYSEAIPLLERALEISKNNDSIARKLYAIDLDNLGLANDAVGHHVEADTLSQQALTVLSNLSSTPEIVSIRGVVFYNIAYRSAERGNVTEAEKYYKLALADISVSSESWRIKTVKANYAEFLKKLGRNAEAEAIK